MTSDADDALSWEGDDEPAARPQKEPALPRGWKAVGRNSDTVGRIEDDGTVTPSPAETRADDADDEDAPQGMSTPMLLFVGVIGGIYLLYTVGWISAAAKLGPNVFIAGVPSGWGAALWVAVAAPLLWFAASWVLTRTAAGWVRVCALLGGALLLIPWPFVMTGVAS